MQILGLIMDILLLLFLAATMVVGFNLSRNITAFRKGRKDLDQLVKDLSTQIEKAERAAAGLKRSAVDSGKDLLDTIEQGRALSDELQLMTESGDNLASRLERLAERNRDIADRIEKNGGKAPSGLSTKEPAMQRAQESKRVPTGPSFAIRDRDVEQEDKRDTTTQVEAGIDDDFSKAERELMAALRMGGK